MSIKTPRIDKIEKAAFGNEIEVSKIDAPFTAIVNEQGNPRQIADLANNMKTSMGVERITTASLSLVDKEFGPNGEPVYSLGDKDPRVRFYGNAEIATNPANSDGTRVYLPASANPKGVEVTFFGTGLNILQFSNGGTDRNLEYFLDGASQGNFVFDESARSAVLQQRGYRMNAVSNVASGLALGYHTIRLEHTEATTEINLHGLEILNESSQLVINAGKPRLDSRDREVVSQVLTDYRSDFDDSSDVVGAKGGRVLVYQNIDGEIKKRFKSVDQAVTSGGPDIERITNGTFDTDLSTWNAVGGYTWVAGTMRANGISQTALPIVFQVGIEYTFTWEITNWAGSDASVQVYENGGASVDGSVPDNPFSGNGIHSITFTALHADSRINFQGITGTWNLDNVSMPEVDPAYNYLALANTDHSNEEIIRRINFREFGANRADDFSTLAASNSNRAFTLDDGTTTLVGNTVYALGTSFFNNANGTHIAITFVGTGLDIVARRNGTSGTFDVSIDGNSNINIPLDGNDLAYYRPTKICSGLPYGTHTVKILRVTGGDYNFEMQDFLVYGPKKPELNDTDIELSEYNIMADYDDSAVTGTANSDGYQVPQGTIFKANTREMIYSGSWVANGMQAAIISGLNIETSSGGSYVDYTFFGTGASIVMDTTGVTNNFQVYFDGGLKAGGTNLVNISDTGGGTYQMTAVGSTVARANFVDIDGDAIPKLHTIRIAFTTTAPLQFVGMFIHTPIHINNTKVGSLGLKDLRVAVDVSEESSKNKIDLGKAKAWLIYDFANSVVIDSYNVSSVIREGAQNGKMYFKNSFKSQPVVHMSGSGVGGTLQYMIRSLLSSQTGPDKHGLDFRADNVSNVPYVCVTCYGELENEEDLDLGDL